MDKKNNIRGMIADSILDRPWGFKAAGQQFYLYPATLGQYLITMRLLEEAGVDLDTFAAHALDISMLLSKTKRDICIKIIATNLMRSNEARNEKNVEKYAKKLEPILDNGDVATLLIAVLTYSQDRINTFISETNLAHDKNDLQRINNVKRGKNSFTFGGRTIYGQLIDSACERYGWTLEYILWGISYINLNMMLNDQVSSVYLSDNELKHVHISNDREILNGDDPESYKKIMEQFKD